MTTRRQRKDLTNGKIDGYAWLLYNGVFIKIVYVLRPWNKKWNCANWTYLFWVMRNGWFYFDPIKVQVQIASFNFPMSTTSFLQAEKKDIFLSTLPRSKLVLSSKSGPYFILLIYVRQFRKKSSLFEGLTSFKVKSKRDFVPINCWFEVTVNGGSASSWPHSSPIKTV